MVEDVKYLGAELQVGCFRDFADLGVFEDREVHVDQSGTGECIASGVSQKIGASVGLTGIGKWNAVRGNGRRCLRQAEALKSDVVVGIARIHGRAATWASHTRGIGPRVGTVHTEGVAADENGEGSAGTGLHDTADLPAIAGPADETGFGLEAWNFPGAADH